MNTHESHPADDHVERLLAAFAPRPSRLDRDRLMFLAGQAAAAAEAQALTEAQALAESRASRSAWYWPASTVVASLSAAVLAVVVVMQSLNMRRADLPSTSIAITPSHASVEQAPVEQPPVAPPTADRSPAAAVVAVDPRENAVRSAEVWRSWSLADNGYWQLRDAAEQPESAEPPQRPYNTIDIEPARPYLHAVRAVLERPQALVLGLRY